VRSDAGHDQRPQVAHVGDLDVQHPPLVSIGVPVYNAERHLARTLDSLLAQTYANLELIVSDNASTDGTQAICEAYARRDSRVRFIRQPRNLGAVANWNAVAREARGEYFKWASASDVCAPTFLEACVGAMRADPGVVLCYGRTQLVDEDERPLELYPGDLAFEEPRPTERFRSVCTRLALNNAQCGVVRRDVLMRTRLDRPYPAGDVALMAELALYGRFRLLPDVLLFRRMSAGTFTSYLTRLELQRFYDPGATSPMRLVRARRHLDHVRSILRAPLEGSEALRALAAALRVAWWDRGGLWHELRSLVRPPRAAQDGGQAP
jgi:glycosyltransferase involved in cell wall biosynthesis